MLTSFHFRIPIEVYQLELFKQLQRLFLQLFDLKLLFSKLVWPYLCFSQLLPLQPDQRLYFLIELSKLQKRLFNYDFAQVCCEIEWLNNQVVKCQLGLWFDSEILAEGKICLSWRHLRQFMTVLITIHAWTHLVSISRLIHVKIPFLLCELTFCARFNSKVHIGPFCRLPPFF